MNKNTRLLSLILLIFINCHAFSQEYRISQGGHNGQTVTFSTCTGMFYDSGGPNGNYLSNEDYTITFCSEEPGAQMSLIFSQFHLESATWDNLTIYDGPSISSPVLVAAAGSQTLRDETILGTGECLTIKFKCDNSVQYQGWAAQIACVWPPQPFTISYVSSDPPVTDTNDRVILACPNADFQLIARGNYPNANQFYPQTDENVTWHWTVTNSEGIHEFNGDNVLDNNDIDFTVPGVNYVALSATDINNCVAVIDFVMQVWVSVPPTFAGTAIDPVIVCPGEQVNLASQVQTYEWEYEFPAVVEDTFCFADDVGVVQYADFIYSTFEPGALLNSLDDIESICLLFEHSYIGDLDMWVECPNGNRVTFVKYPSGCGLAYFGEAYDEFLDDAPDVDCDNPSTMGTMYEYCWSPTGAQTVTDICGGYRSVPIPSFDHNGTFYAADPDPVTGISNSFTNLLGCPLNGTWRVGIQDNMGSDDGTATHFEMNFSDNIIEQALENTISFENVYDISAGSTTAWWTGIDMNNDHGGTATANPATPGQQAYVFHATDDFGCTYDTTINITVRSVDDPLCCQIPTPDLGDDVHLCTNTYTFSGQLSHTGNTGEWTVVDGPSTDVTWSNRNAINATVTVPVDGEYTFRWTELYYGHENCSATDDIKVAFWTAPTPTFTCAPVLCYGDNTTVTYTGNMDPTLHPTAVFSWDFPDATIISGSGSGPFVINWPGTGMHTLTLSVEHEGCLSGDTTINVRVPEPLATTIATVDDPCFQSCKGQAEVSTTGGIQPYNYSWASATNAIANLCAGDYIVTVTDANNCTIAQPFTIGEPAEPLTIDSMPHVNLTCYKSHDGSIDVVAHGGTGSYQYLWSDIGVNINERTALEAGQYCVTVSDRNGCTTSECVVVTQPDELLVVITNNTSICEGQSIAIQTQAIGGTPDYHYFWTESDGVEYEASAMQMVTPDTSNNFSVYVVDAHNCLSNTATMTLTVSPEMKIDSIITVDNKCYHSCDGSAEIHLQGGLPPLTYSWGSSDNVISDICAGVYTVTITDVIGCNTSGMFIINEPTRLSLLSHVEEPKCHGSADGEIRLNLQGGTPPYHYLWPDNRDTAVYTTCAGTFTVTMTDDNGCRKLETFTVKQPEAISVVPMSEQTACYGQKVRLTTQVTGGTPYYNYEWRVDSIVVSNSNVYEGTITEATTFRLVVTDNNGCRDSSATVTVNVFPKLKICSIASDVKDTVQICPNDTARIYVEVEGGNGGPYILTLQDGTIVPKTFCVSPKVSTTYVVELNDMCGTPPVQDSIAVAVRPQSVVDFEFDKRAGCRPLPVLFKPKFDTAMLSLGRPYKYSWLFGDDGFNNAAETPTHIYEKEGLYDVRLTVEDSIFGCKTYFNKEHAITVYPSPEAMFETSQERYSILSSEVQFINHTVPLDSCNYYWYFGDGDSSLLVNTQHVYHDLGAFEVMLVAENERNCRDTTVRKLTIESPFAFYMPTSFTPNGDGRNDCIRPCGKGIDRSGFHLYIYDRWGTRVFETDIFRPELPCESCAEGSWDGTYKNKNKGDTQLPVGNYNWYCEFKDWNGVGHKEYGIITLLR